jgi:hypothetical protein
MGFSATPNPFLLSPRTPPFVAPNDVRGRPFSLFPTPGRRFLANARKDRVMRGRRPERSEGCLAHARQDKKWALGRTKNGRLAGQKMGARRDKVRDLFEQPLV